MLRLLKILRMFKLSDLRSSRGGAVDLRFINPAIVGLLKYVGVLIYCWHVVACVYWGIGSRECCR